MKWLEKVVLSYSNLDNLRTLKYSDLALKFSNLENVVPESLQTFEGNYIEKVGKGFICIAIECMAVWLRKHQMHLILRKYLLSCLNEKAWLWWLPKYFNHIVLFTVNENVFEMSKLSGLLVVIEILPCL